MAVKNCGCGIGCGSIPVDRSKAGRARSDLRARLDYSVPIRNMGSSQHCFCAKSELPQYAALCTRYSHQTPGECRGAFQPRSKVWPPPKLACTGTGPPLLTFTAQYLNSGILPNGSSL